MKKKFTLIVFTGILILSAALVTFAQDVQWNVGDKVEILNLSKEWSPGTIIGTVDWNGTLMYRVKLDDENASTVYFNHTPVSDIRPRGGVNQPLSNNQQQNDIQPQNFGGAFQIGDTVDTFYDRNRGHNRGVILEVGDRRFKVHYAGCEKTFDEWVDASLVQPPATISTDAPEITFLSGKWRLTTVAVGGNYAVWGSSPGIQINADGTYVWYENSTNKPTRGRWRTDAKVPKLNEGTQKFDGIIVKDSAGNEWKAFRWRPAGETKDLIEIDRMCSGLSEVGSRF